MLGATLLFAGASRAADGKPIDKDIARWLVQLSDRVPGVRESARDHLRSIDREDLESLREAMVRNFTVAKEHEELLQEIVDQVFLASEPYDSVGQHGFLGVRFDVDQLAAFDDPTILPYFGVEIHTLLPGLAGSKYLEVGDVVMAVKVGEQTYELPNAHDMMTTIGSLSAGEKVTFRLLRRGKMLDVPAVLGARPAGLMEEPGVIEQFNADRESRAQDYWDEHFAPIFDGRISPPAARASVGP
jgi:hypothetical protein